jgi:hypothetical protein
MKQAQGFSLTELDSNVKLVTLTAALKLLEQAHAVGTKQSRLWEFSVELEVLKEVGLTHTHVRWLLAKAYLIQKVETTPAQARRRTFREVNNGSFNPRSCFVLTTRGLELAQFVLGHASKTDSASNGKPREPDVPHREVPDWNPKTGELRWKNRLVKKIACHAWTLRQLLQVFQKKHWGSPVKIKFEKNECDAETRQRLHEAIKGLNKNQHLILFHGDGTGLGATWELNEEALEELPQNSHTTTPGQRQRIS